MVSWQGDFYYGLLLYGDYLYLWRGMFNKILTRTLQRDSSEQRNIQQDLEQANFIYAGFIYAGLPERLTRFGAPLRQYSSERGLFNEFFFGVIEQIFWFSALLRKQIFWRPNL